jgi:hypothetical protein
MIRREGWMMNWPSNINANSRHVGLWALTMEIIYQQKMLRSTLKEVLSKKPINFSDTTTYFKTVEEFKDVEIDNLATSWKHVYKNAKSKLRTLTGNELGSEVVKVLHLNSYILPGNVTRSKSVCVGDYTFYLSLTESGFVCSTSP